VNGDSGAHRPSIIGSTNGGLGANASTLQRYAGGGGGGGFAGGGGGAAGTVTGGGGGGGSSYTNTNHTSLTFTNISMTAPTGVLAYSGSSNYNSTAGTAGIASGSASILGGAGSNGLLVATYYRPTIIGSGEILAPDANAGTDTFTQGLTLITGSILNFDLGTTGDLVRVSGGTLTGPSGTGGVTLNFSNSGGFGLGTYTLINYTSATLNNFEATDFTLGTTIPGYIYNLALSGNTLQLTASAIPEPSTYAAIFGALVLGLAVYRKRRRA